MPDSAPLSVTQGGLNQLYQMLGREQHAVIEANLRIAALGERERQLTDALVEVKRLYGPPDESEQPEQPHAGPTDQVGPLDIQTKRRRRGQAVNEPSEPDTPAAGG